MAKNLKTKLQDMAVELKEITAKLDGLLEAFGAIEQDKAKVEKKPAKKKPTGKKASSKKTAAKKPVVKKAPSNKKVKTALDQVFMYIARTKKGLDTNALVKKTGFDKKKVSNSIYKLKKQGKIVSNERGKYVKA